MRKKTKSIIFKLIIVLIGIISVIAETGVFDGQSNFEIFGMFTTISNIVVIAYYIIDIHFLLNEENRNKCTWCPTLKGMNMVSIILTFSLSFFVLKMTFSFSSYISMSFIGLHYIVPIMTVTDWIIFDKKGLYKRNSPLIWSILPIVYTVLAFILSQIGDGFSSISGSKYPYPFMDIETLGLGKVSISYIVIIIMFLGMCYSVCLIDNKMKIKKRTRK